MSHFTAGIIIPPQHLDDVQGYVEEQLAPQVENIAVGPYVCYSLEQAQRDLAEDIQQLHEILDSWNPAYDFVVCEQRLAELQQMTPEQWYREYASPSDRNSEAVPGSLAAAH